MSPEDKAALQKALMGFWRLMKSQHAVEAEEEAAELVDALSELEERTEKR